MWQEHCPHTSYGQSKHQVVHSSIYVAFEVSTAAWVKRASEDHNFKSPTDVTMKIKKTCNFQELSGTAVYMGLFFSIQAGSNIFFYT